MQEQQPPPATPDTGAALIPSALVSVCGCDSLVCRTRGCGNVLSEVDQVLSTEHAWSLDSPDQAAGRVQDYRRHRGAESACFVNSLRPGSFSLRNERVELLAQGPMTVADVSCADCHRVVGWKFVRSGQRPRKQARRRRPAAGPDGAPTPASPAAASAAPGRPGIWSLLRRGRSSPEPEDGPVSDSGSDDDDESSHPTQTTWPFVGLSRGNTTPGVLGRRNLNQEGRFGLVDSRIRLASQPEDEEDSDEDTDEAEQGHHHPPMPHSSESEEESSSDDDAEEEEEEEEEEGLDDASERGAAGAQALPMAAPATPPAEHPAAAVAAVAPPPIGPPPSAAAAAAIAGIDPQQQQQQQQAQQTMEEQMDDEQPGRCRNQ